MRPPSWGAGPDRRYAAGDRVLLHTKAATPGLHNGSVGTVVAVEALALVVAIQRSASWSRWPRACPIRSHSARSCAYSRTSSGPEWTVSARSILASRERIRAAPQERRRAP